MGLAELTQTSGWKNFMAKLYGIGAAVVIVGALFKIMHWPGAGPMLVAGLGVEAVIFFFSAFEPIHEEIDWSLVYPQLAGLSEEDEVVADLPAHAATGGNALASFDKMLEKAGGADLFDRLGAGLTKLSDSAGQMANIADASVATAAFTTGMKAAASSANSLSESMSTSAESLNYSIETLADSYSKSATKVTESTKEVSNSYARLAQSMNVEVDFSVVTEGNKSYNQHLGTLNKNLTALNAIFEMQLDANLDQMMEDLTSTVDETRRYQKEVQKLGTKLEALNTVYGNMLTAMNVNLNH
ncbi:MAG TPA: hypothetical protein DCQ31_08485 [Bacteroidales bacterium]|nr:hypothetical protein [Bacteroidales bacterium]